MIISNIVPQSSTALNFDLATSQTSIVDKVNGLLNDINVSGAAIANATSNASLNGADLLKFQTLITENSVAIDECSKVTGMCVKAINTLVNGG